MDTIKGFQLFPATRTLKPWTRVDSIDLLTGIHVNSSPLNFRALARSRDDVDDYYGDISISMFTFERTIQKESRFDLFESFYEERKVGTLTADGIGVSEDQWSKEKTIALFDGVCKGGPCKSDEVRFHHYYDVVGTIYRRHAQDGSLEKGIFKAVDAFYKAGCPKVSLTRHQACSLSMGWDRVATLVHGVSRAAGRLAGYHGKLKES